ncbi:MAG: hypothetical protein A2W98_05980 [Bacteroidetes bacterium GWF2_33_38]|nr:MAG: hypothetical protein A2W98_05980 [Bacteroidetes bacterium GWF2_33_38]OFY74233.1 MAG: hypothetical protein A2265_00705 [Bacteroidetes bacterium RIFOXYA12_FULL_33_9]OFY91957.1 MAG: hypothetical protein A2236_02180 [Bacteroidetes bacterium RIFOXYA2_FULL_33_7]HBX49592.1 hypothetical protein [Bacteroidales bacterium]
MNIFKILHTVLLTFLSLFLFAQQIDTVEILKSKKLNYSLQMGTSVTVFNKSSYFNSFIAPKVSYQISPKFGLSLGGILMRTNFQPSIFVNSTSEINNHYSTAFNQNFLFVQASYSVNEHLSISGTVYQLVNKIPNNNSQRQRYSIAADYKLKNGMSFGIELSNSDTPFVNNLSQSPYKNHSQIKW